MRYVRAWTFGIFIALSFVALSAVGPTTASAQGNGPCVDTASWSSRNYKSNYEAIASLTDPAIVAFRTENGIPTLIPSQVRLVADTTVCRAASTAFDTHVQTPHPLEPVIVLELGTKRLVVKDLGHGAKPSMLFNVDFTTLLNSFWN
jgi:hypothetical protein